MSKSRAKKADNLAKYRDRISRAQIAVFSFYSGLTVSQESKLRKLLKAADADYFVPKKTLLRMAYQESGQSGIDFEALNKPFSLTLGYADAAAVTKILMQFKKENEKLVIAGGLLDGKALQSADIVALAKLPSRIELLAQLTRTVQAPVSGFVAVFRANLTGLLNVLSGIKPNQAS